MHRIFLVDDSAEDLAILGELLRDYERRFARNGPDALKALRSMPPPDLILLDVMMPNMSGFEVCEALKEDDTLSRVPVIFITALGATDSEMRGFELGAVDYITKPFKAAVVKARVSTHLALKKAREELAAQNVVLEERVQARTSELKQALELVRQGSMETVLRLSRAAEYRDESTGQHIVRMSHYSAAIARQYGMGEDRAKALLYSAPMHDVGKIGIPDHILMKPGKLTPEEMDCMKTHTLIGAKILAGSSAEVIQLAELVAISHHEKWDGSGYPHGIKGDTIPIYGRICAVADVFDALTTDRPYKKAFSVDDSIRMIREGRGSHFDPAVADAFFDSRAEILKIKSEFADAAVKA